MRASHHVNARNHAITFSLVVLLLCGMHAFGQTATPATPQAFADFVKAMFDYADAHPVQRVVVDLRFNGGGNSEVINPLVRRLQDRPALSRHGHLYALIGPGTFSSAMMAALSFQRKLGAILVGEPLAENQNSYGEVRVLTLPNSQVPVWYSTKFFRFDRKNKHAPPLTPDILVRRSLADVRAGRGRALEAALTHSLD